MRFWEALALLGLEDDDLSRDHVRRTYLRKLKDYPPERDPAGFKRLREAFELVRTRAHDPEPEAGAASAAGADPLASVVRDTLEGDGGAVRVAPVVAPVVADAAPVVADAAPSPYQLADAAFAILAARVPAPPPVPVTSIIVDVAPPLAEPPPAATSIVIEVAPPPPAATSIVIEVAPPIAEPVRAPDDAALWDAPKPPAAEPDVLAAPPPPPLRIVPPPPQTYVPLPPLALLPKPALPLAQLVRQVLDALAAHDVPRARTLETAWLADPDATDFRNAGTTLDVARWHVTRELLGVASDLPQRVLRHLALGIQADNVAGAKPALEMYRDAYPKQAGRAHSVLHDRARDIFKQIEGSLWKPREATAAEQDLAKQLGLFGDARKAPHTNPVVPPSRPPPFFEPPPPNVRPARGMFGSIGAFGVIAVAMLRLCATMGSNSSSPFSSGYHVPDLSNLKFDPHLLDHINPNPPMPDLDALNHMRFHAPIPPSDRETSDDTRQRLADSLYTLDEPAHAPTSEFAAIARSLEVATITSDCKTMLATLPKLVWPDAPPANMPTDDDLAHLQFIGARVHTLCPDPKAKAKTPPKKPPAKPKAKPAPKVEAE